jgi:hypothetical protein
LAVAVETGSKPASQCIVDVAAGLATLMGDFACAARFHVAAEAHAGQTGVQRDAADEALLAPLVAQARAGLSSAALAAATAAGRELRLDAALAEVRAWLAADAPAARRGAGPSRSSSADR